MTHDEAMNVLADQWAKDDADAINGTVFAVRGVSELGHIWYYTGKGGEKWISPEKSAAFTYGLEGAQRKALMFNRTSELHGLRFVAEPVR